MTRAQPQPWAATVVAPECPAVNNPADARHGYGRIDGSSEPATRASRIWKWQPEKDPCGHVKRPPRCCVVEATAR